MIFDYTISYEYLNEQEDEAWARQGLIQLLSLFQVGVVSSNIKQNHVGDVFLNIRFRYKR